MARCKRTDLRGTGDRIFRARITQDPAHIRADRRDEGPFSAKAYRTPPSRLSAVHASGRFDRSEQLLGYTVPVNRPTHPSALTLGERLRRTPFGAPGHVG